MLDLCVVFTVRLYLSVWEDTGARDMCGFFICTCLGVLVLYVGDRVSVHGDHVTAVWAVGTSAGSHSFGFATLPAGSGQACYNLHAV